MSDTPIFDEVVALLAARNRPPAPSEPEPAETEEEEVPPLCSWCGLPLDDISDRRAVTAQDPVAGDDILLAACCAEHAAHLRRRYRVAT